MSSGGAERTKSRVLCGVFFLSGASALLFENLWFRRAGLAFGNSVWASALVLSSFMGGLALGNGIAARIGRRVRHPEKLYAAAELAIAIVGIAVVALLPRLGELFTPLFRSLSDEFLALNALRLGLSFLLLLIPATAMGLTLPLLVKALLQDSRQQLGPALGRLYGWNTLGAVVGALAGEWVLVEALGLFGTASVAALLTLVAAVVALKSAERDPEDEPLHPIVATPRSPLSPRARALLTASFLSGTFLLALEVVWFRFLQLFLPGTTRIFAAMLAVVLLGIGLGGLFASRWFVRNARAHHHTGLVALSTGLLAMASYAAFGTVLEGGSIASLGSASAGREWILSLALMFPTTLASGALFTLLGHALHEEIKRVGQANETRSTGLATMANTLGATLGPLLAGFFLIPRIGAELSFLVVGIGYFAVFLLLWRGAVLPLRRIPATLITASFCAAAVLFPFGRMDALMEASSAKYREDGSSVVAVREGVVETLQYLERDFAGEPLYHRLVTNSYSMSGTHAYGKRYMKYYVYWPIAVHPEPREALLISFGTGSTAKALVDSRELEHIDVVDISPEILEMADVVFPKGDNPLRDRRVKTHVEDGRFFLQTSGTRYDLITSEPPPLKMAGVVNLYTQEYFQLLHDRLAPGGVATYWLPVIQLSEDEAKAVCRAWLEVFGEEATLWSGCGLDWMLVGTRDLKGPLREGRFLEQWNDAVVGPELRKLGFEDPGQIGATFLFGAQDLLAWTEGIPPLVDDRPQRLSSELVADRDSMARYHELMGYEAAQKRFLASRYVRERWPESLLHRSLEYFPVQGVLNDVTAAGPDRMTSGSLDFGFLHHVLTRTEVKTPVLWAFGSGVDEQEIVARLAPEERTSPEVTYQRAIGALAERRYVDAEGLLASSRPDMLELRLYLLCVGRDENAARRLVAANPGALPQGFLDWLTQTVGFDPRREA